MKKLLLGISKIIFLALLTSCSLYFDEFDTSVYEGVKNYSVTDLEKNIIEMPGDQQDILIEAPNTKDIASCCSKAQETNNCAKKVWICDKINCDGVLEVGHYQIFLNEKK